LAFVASVLLSCKGGGGDTGSVDEATDSTETTSDGTTTTGETSDTSDTDDTGDTDTGDPPPDPSCDDFGDAVDADGTVPGTVAFPFPTLEHITMVWEIQDDQNENGTVTVRYRTTDGGQWREGTPLRRVPAGSNEGFDWTNKHAGSLFALQPDTTYEVELFLSDPDGGCAIETQEVSTRPVPQAAPNAPVIQVNPGNIDSMATSAGPGDILELQSGSYGEIVFPNDGTRDEPIVLRGTDGAVVDGDVRLDSRSHVLVEDLTINGKVKFNGGVGIAVKGCTVNAVDDGIITFTRAEDAYIADNVVVGTTSWVEDALGASGNNLGEGIAVTGPGHVIEHNRVRGFRDAISLLEDSGAVDQYSIDILRNEVSEAADDGIEADFCFHNCRVLENRLTNVFIALSSQPGLGGPTYFVRNAMYNVILSSFKLQRSSVGDVLWHNTSVKNGDAFGIYTSDVFSRQHSRNNLFLGGPGGDYNGWSSGSGRVIQLAAAENVDLDYDGVGSMTGEFTGRIGDTTFSSLDELQSMTTEAHAVELGFDVFDGAVSYPADPLTQASAQDLRVANDSAAVDAGASIPGINDGYAGDGPDLGAYEVGAPLPDYGPR
jgi:hypothetical protein